MKIAGLSFQKIIILFLVLSFLEACEPNKGNHIAFKTIENNGKPHISIIDANGKNKTSIKTGMVLENCPTWSNDGKRLFFTAVTYNDTVNNPSSNLYTIEMDGDNIKQLTRGKNQIVYATLSPDGSHVLFSAKDGNGISIYKMNYDGTNIIKLNQENFLMSVFPQWSPDGKQIIFSSNPSQGRYENPYFSIFKMSSDGGVLVQITNEKEIDYAPVWSPNGDKIVFYATYEYHLSGEGPMFWKNANIFIMNSDGTDKKKITDSSEPVLDISPGWSPDGRKIVFASNRDHKDSPQIFDLYTINTDGTNTTRITNAGNNQCPVWQP
jgi:Tol biopolymer transport system component